MCEIFNKEIIFLFEGRFKSVREQRTFDLRLDFLG